MGVVELLKVLIGGILILLSLVGLGSFVRWALGARDEAPHGYTIAIGLSVFSLALSLLGLAHAITPVAVLFLEAAGLVALVANRRAALAQWQSFHGAPYFWLVTAALVAVYLRSLYCLHFEVLDDFTGYLPVVEKVVQTGGFGRDPFSLYRLQAGAGSYWLLQSVFAMQFGYYQLAILNPAFGIVIGTLAVTEYARSLVPPRLAVFLGIMAAGLLAIPDANFTPHAVLAGPTIALVLALMSGRLRGLPEAICAGLVAGLVLSLKITQLPLLGIAALTWIIYEWRQSGDGRRVFVLAAAALGAMVVVLLPGMYALKLASGTYLYPIFGNGTYGAVYGTVIGLSDGVTVPQILKSFLLTKRGFLALPLTVGVTIATIWTYFRANTRSLADTIVVVLAFAVLPLCLLISYEGGAEFNALRYMFPTYVTVDVVAIVWLCRIAVQKGMLTRPLSFASLAAVGGLFVLAWASYFLAQSYVDLRFLAFGDPARALADQNRYVPMGGTASLFDESQRAGITKAQSKARPGAVILAYTLRFDGFDYRRNEILSSSHYFGSASPAPGIPVDGSGIQLRDYLRSVGVDYVLFQHAGDERVFRRDVDLSRKTYASSPWNLSVNEAAAKAPPAFTRLMAVVPVPYRDDHYALLQVR